jgi:hypothetical protein
VPIVVLCSSIAIAVLDERIPRRADLAFIVVEQVAYGTFFLLLVFFEHVVFITTNIVDLSAMIISQCHDLCLTNVRLLRYVLHIFGLESNNQRSSLSNGDVDEYVPFRRELCSLRC